MALQYCLNGECVNFQIEVETDRTRCPMCAWEMQLIKKHSDSGFAYLEGRSHRMVLTVTDSPNYAFQNRNVRALP